MRWLLLLGVLASCATDSVDLPATIVHVTVNADCGGECERLGHETGCGYDMQFIEPAMHDVVVYTSHEPSELAGLVQLQYAGSLALVDQGELDHLDGVLAPDERLDVYGLADYDGTAPLYRIDGVGGVTDIDTARLVAAEGSTLHFAYGAVTEDHVIDAPRTVNAQTEDSDCYCAVGGQGLAGILVIVLIPWRRRRKLRA